MAERYLKEHRGICLEKYPHDIRFHPGIYSKINGKSLSALLVIVRNSDHRLQAVQAIYLDEITGQKIDKVIAPLQKQTFGVLRGALVTLSTTSSYLTIIVEGSETGLSLAQSLPLISVKATLGKSNLLNVDDQSLHSTVILALDNDNKLIKEDPVLITVIGKWLERGKDVRLMMPQCLGHLKQDYNDVLRQKGETVIRQDFDKAVSGKQLIDRSLGNTLSPLFFQHKQVNDSSPLPTSQYVDKEVVKVKQHRQREIEREG